MSKVEIFMFLRVIMHEVTRRFYEISTNPVQKKGIDIQSVNDEANQKMKNK